MPPRKQKQNQSNRNVNQKSEAQSEHSMSTRSSRSKILSSDEEQEENEIYKGFCVQKDTKPLILTLPFTVQPSVTIDDFYKTLLPACDAILQIHHNEGENQIEFSHIHRRMAQAISKTPQITTAYESLCQHIQSFCNDLPHQISSYCENAESIGIFWNSIEDKINKIMILFDSLSYKSKTIPEVFSQYCYESFKSNIELFEQASQLIIDSYNEYRETKQKPPIDSSIQFLKETGLFNDYFIPHFIDSVIQYIQPKIDEFFETYPFSEYLETVTEISESELDLATVFGNYSLSLQLNDQINKLIFSSKMDQIYDKCLRPLLKDQEIDSIWTCSKLARSTDAFNSFIHIMAQLFEEEATSCFSSNHKEEEDQNDNNDNDVDPISKLLRLYKSLMLFCSKACGPQSTRTVRLAFERGFNSQPEIVARLLALSVNSLFNEKDVDDNDNDKDDSFNYELIDQYVALFRMLSLNDVFETYHTQLLTRRILTMKDKMVQPETFFIEKLKQQCGAEYTRRMEDLFQDRAVSQDLLTNFVKENKEKKDKKEQNQNQSQKQKKSKSSQKNSKNQENNSDDDDEDDETIPDSCLSCFNCLVISAQTAKTWASLKTVRMTPPSQISLLLSKFANYYRSNMSRRNIAWNLQLATVKLKVLNVVGLEKVKCSADFAIILLAFNSESLEDRLKKLKRNLKTIEKEEKEKVKKELNRNKNSKKKTKKNEKSSNKKKNQAKSKSSSRSRDDDEDEETVYSNDDDDDTISSEDDEENEDKTSENENENENEDENSGINESSILKEIKEIEDDMKKKWNGTLSFDQLIKTVDGNEDEILSRIRVLKSKKSNKLLLEEKVNSQGYVYKINKNCEAPNGLIVLPFIFPQLAEKEEERAKKTIIDNKDNQLDAAIVSVLKAEKTMEKSFLYNKILNIVKFKVNKDFFENRLQKLEQKVFLKIDPSGKVHYVNA